jgi:hypothetical protein
MKKYELTIEKATGSCNTELFKKMAMKGDITASKIEEFVGKVVKITGWAEAHIVTDEKEFNITYYATDDGYFSTGSKYFNESLDDYLGDTDTFKILKIKTKKGHTYKASPIFVNNEE